MVSALPAVDHPASPTIAMSATSGKVALVQGTTALSGCPTANVIDKVGYGTSNCSEATAAAVLSVTEAGFRNNNGCTDTDNNQADFTNGTPAPRNSASPVFICGSVPTPPSITAGTLVDFGSVNVGSASASQNFSINGSNLTGAPGNITVTAPNTNFQVSLDGTTWSASVNVPYTGATLAATQIFVQFTPQSAGAQSGNINISGGGVSTAVTVAVSGTVLCPVLLHWLPQERWPSEMLPQYGWGTKLIYDQRIQPHQPEYYGRPTGRISVFHHFRRNIQ